MKPVCTCTKYDRTQAELQQYILTCILTAGNRAEFARQKVNQITADVPDGQLPCRYLSDKKDLDAFLQNNRTGKYRHLSKSIRRIAELDLATVTESELRTIPGVSFKTARIFLLRTRHDVQHAVLDTHTLKYLRERGVMDVPEKSPSKECEYLRLESELIRLFSEEFPTESLAQADSIVWEHYRNSLARGN